MNTKINAHNGGDVVSLANKYRPKTLDDVVEQSLVVEILSNMCKSGLKNRNFLFTGPAGTGKTSFARILANSIGAQDIIEIDAASYSGADNMRGVVQQANSYPLVGNYKVFIIDEVHALSSQAWAVALKTLEESPAATVFMLCTTNPEKIPDTIISRVQRFNLSKISLDGITNRLRFVLDSEIRDGRDIRYTEPAIKYIAKLANGGMRDALTLLDKALSYSEDVISENLSKALSLPNYDDYFKLLGAYAKKDNATVTSVVHDVYNSGINFTKWFEEFHSFLVNIMKYVLIEDISKTMIPDHYASKLSKYNEAHAAVCLNLGNRVLRLLSEMKHSQYQQEIALTYLCVFK